MKKNLIITVLCILIAAIIVITGVLFVKSLKKDNDGSVKVTLSLHCRTRSDAETEHLIRKVEKTSGIHLDRFE